MKNKKKNSSSNSYKDSLKKYQKIESENKFSAINTLMVLAFLCSNKDIWRDLIRQASRYLEKEPTDTAFKFATFLKNYYDDNDFLNYYHCDLSVINWKYISIQLLSRASNLQDFRNSKKYRKPIIFK